VTSRSFSSGSVDLDARLEAAGYRPVRGATSHELDGLLPVLAEAVAWIAGTAPVTAEHLRHAPKLRVIARYGVGVDAVDLDAAARAGVVVTNTPGANSDAVAEHAVALLFAVLRGVAEGDRRVRRDEWQVSRGRQVAGATVGVVGGGRIGRAVVWRLRGLGCDVLLHDPYLPAERIAETGARPASLTEIRDGADVVTLHAPGGARVVDEAWTRACRPGQVVVNTARADLTDDLAVAAALRTGRLGGYATDVLDPSPEDTASPLRDPDLADRVVVTPHLGAQTIEAVDRMGSAAVDDVLAVLAGRQPTNPVPPTPGAPS
jgi:D-3-phosphoglycerate dehydrogenase